MINNKKYNLLKKIYFSQLEKVIDEIHPYIVRAFEPHIFNNSGFSSFNKFSNLKFLTNSQHNGRYDNYLKVDLWGVFTDEEFKIICKLFDVSAEINLHLDGRKTPSLDSIFAAVLAVRLIEKKLKKGSTLLEIGPGSGFVTAMLALKGYRVITVDVLPNFVFYQNMFFEHLFGKKFKYDFSFTRSKINKFSVLQLSWWNFINIKNKLLNIDAITINHSLNEVSKMAMHYYLSICEKQNKTFSVFVENVGFTTENNNFNNFFQNSNKYKIYHKNFHGDVEFNKSFVRGAYIQYQLNHTIPAKSDNLTRELYASNTNYKVSTKFKVISYLLLQNILNNFLISFLRDKFISLTTKLRIFIRSFLFLVGLGGVVRFYFYIKSKFSKKQKSIDIPDEIKSELDEEYFYDKFKFSYTYLDLEKYLHKNFEMNAFDTWDIYSAIYDWDPNKHHFNDK